MFPNDDVPSEAAPIAIASGDESQGGGAETNPEFLQAAIATAIARSFMYRFLAKAFEDPNEPGWRAFTGSEAQENLVHVLAALPADAHLVNLTRKVRESLNAETFDSYSAAYVTTFGHAARGQCPLNEIEYGDLKADALFQPHRLADLAAFYRAFGLEVAEDAGERQDHLCLELEFMCVLAAKEAFALEYQFDSEDLEIGRASQKKFLREHLARWLPAFTHRLSRTSGTPVLTALADFARAFVISECQRFGVPPGSDDLLLRPIDEASESLCASCGVSKPPPGAPNE